MRESAVRIHILQTIFGLALGVAAFWTIGLAWNLALGWDPDPMNLFIISCFLAAGGAYLAFQLWPEALIVPLRAGWGMLFLEFLTALLHGYVGWAVLIAVVGSGLLALGVLSGRDAGTFVILMTVWFPLWLMVPTACVLTASRLRRAR
jgi:hypothetical protein